MVPGQRAVAARAWLLAATVLGLGHAAISLAWVLGATWLLATVGGSIEEMARDGGWAVRLGLLGVVLLKVVAVLLPWLALSRPERVLRALAWVSAAILTVYGAVYTGVGLLALYGPIDVTADADLHALRWHADLWDPWFLLWGVCTLVVLLTNRDARTARPR